MFSYSSNIDSNYHVQQPDIETNINNPVELSSKRDTDGTSVICPTSLGLDAHDIMSSKQQ